MKMEKTEKQFSNWCKKNKFFSKKFLTHTFTGKGGNQESDFMIANDKLVAFVELKERLGGRFNINDLTQYRKLKALERKSTIILLFVIINFEKEKTLVKLSLKEFEEFSSLILLPSE